LTKLFLRFRATCCVDKRKIVINTQGVDVVKAFGKYLFVVFGVGWSMTLECPL
jgi:hypothetical protein